MARYFSIYNKATFFRIYFSRYFYPFYKKSTAYSTPRAVDNISNYGYFYSDSYYLSRNSSRETLRIGSDFTPYNKFIFQAFFTYFNVGDRVIYDIYWFNYKNKVDLFKNFFICFIRFKFQVSFSFKFIKLFCFVNSFKQFINLNGYFFSDC
jgi:hypothetical protein